jgi:hypothetical protein
VLGGVLNLLKSLNLTKLYPNNKNNNNNKVKSKPLELYELAGKLPASQDAGNGIAFEDNSLHKIEFFLTT